MAIGDEVLSKFTQDTVEEAASSSNRRLKVGIIGTG